MCTQRDHFVSIPMTTLHISIQDYRYGSVVDAQAEGSEFESPAPTQETLCGFMCHIMGVWITRAHRPAASLKYEASVQGETLSQGTMGRGI